MPASTSPMPALPMPGLPVRLMNRWPSAATELEGGAPGEHGGPVHAGCAAEDPERAGHALVEMQRPALERIPEEFRYGHPGARLTRRQAEVVDRDRAAAIRTVERQQSGLQANEGNGVARPDRAAHHPAGVRMQAARRVDREHPTALAGCINHP